jgi:maltodextrin utilization protein YvdJ
MSLPPSHSAWKRRLKNWSDPEWLHQQEDKVILVLTLIIGAVVGLVSFLLNRQALPKSIFRAPHA